MDVCSETTFIQNVIHHKCVCMWANELLVKFVPIICMPPTPPATSSSSSSRKGIRKIVCAIYQIVGKPRTKWCGEVASGGIVLVHSVSLCIFICPSPVTSHQSPPPPSFTTNFTIRNRMELNNFWERQCKHQAMQRLWSRLCVMAASEFYVFDVCSLVRLHHKIRDLHSNFVFDFFVCFSLRFSSSIWSQPDDAHIQRHYT